jgi:hypothetical protein
MAQEFNHCGKLAASELTRERSLLAILSAATLNEPLADAAQLTESDLQRELLRHGYVWNLAQLADEVRDLVELGLMHRVTIDGHAAGLRITPEGSEYMARLQKKLIEPRPGASASAFTEYLGSVRSMETAAPVTEQALDRWWSTLCGEIKCHVFTAYFESLEHDDEVAHSSVVQEGF